jgi:4-hydroxy-tetrahydrodipicolinate reductase
MRLLIIGAGRMGRAVETLAIAAGHTVTDVLDSRSNAGAQAIRARRDDVDVAIEVTEAAVAAANALACIEARIPVVVGTTGWYEQRRMVEQRAREQGGAILIAPNFSLGVALATEVVRAAGTMFAAHAQFEAAIVETHHSAKKDAPSGTAKALADAVAETLGRQIPIASVRVGSAPGTHTLIFDGPFEQIVITHEARDRRVFADGALRAAAWLVGKTGVFSMRDVTAPNG